MFERSIDTIFIMLGSNCNFNCKYCMQQGNQREFHIENPQEINKDVYTFIEDILSQQYNDIVLMFYGGEPFAYFDSIKEIVQHFKNNKRVHYCAISNGSLITQEVVDFLNANDVRINISWDGRATKQTRLIDVFETKKDILFQINKLGITSVLSAYTRPKQILEDVQLLSNEYKAVHPHHNHLIVNIDALLDTGISDRSLYQDNSEVIAQDIKELFDTFSDIRSEKMKITDEEFDTKYVIMTQYIQELIDNLSYSINRVKSHHKFVQSICFCGNGYNVLNLDLQGNLYICHNSSIKVGNVHTPYFNYLTNVIAHDATKKNFKTKCKDCPAVLLCNAGCKLMTEKVREETYCKFRIALCETLINSVLKRWGDNG